MSYKKKSPWLQTFFINQAAAIIITVILTAYSGFNVFKRSLIFSLIFSNCIGFLICSFLCLCDRMEITFSTTFKKFKILGMVMATFLGICLGTFMALLIIKFILGYNIAYFKRDLLYLLGGNVFVASIAVAIILTYNKLKNDLENKIVENQRIKQLQIQTKLLVLQSKINPHFLFNTLNTMLNLISRSPKKVESLILNLSEIYRKVLELPENSTIPLKKEIELIREYLEIEKIRMGKRLDFTIWVDGLLEEFQVPPLLIEPVVENSIIHGITPKARGGSIQIDINKRADYVHINVTDNGVGINMNNHKTGFGLSSIKERLQLIYKGEATFKIRSNESGDGTQVILELPYEN